MVISIKVSLLRVLRWRTPQHCNKPGSGAARHHPACAAFFDAGRNGHSGLSQPCSSLVSAVHRSMPTSLSSPANTDQGPGLAEPCVSLLHLPDLGDLAFPHGPSRPRFSDFSVVRSRNVCKLDDNRGSGNGLFPSRMRCGEFWCGEGMVAPECVKGGLQCCVPTINSIHARR